jgi:hypothetical protein
MKLLAATLTLPSLDIVCKTLITNIPTKLSPSQPKRQTLHIAAGPYGSILIFSLSRTVADCQSIWLSLPMTQT